MAPKRKHEKLEDSDAQGGTATSTPEEPGRKTGTVKWFNDAKGFGFIVCSSEPDHFVHHSEIRRAEPGRRTLGERDEVTFTSTKGPKGWVAKDVAVTKASSW